MTMNFQAAEIVTPVTFLLTLEIRGVPSYERAYRKSDADPCFVEILLFSAFCVIGQWTHARFLGRDDIAYHKQQAFSLSQCKHLQTQLYLIIEFLPTHVLS